MQTATYLKFDINHVPEGGVLPEPRVTAYSDLSDLLLAESEKVAHILLKDAQFHLKLEQAGWAKPKVRLKTLKEIRP